MENLMDHEDLVVHPDVPVEQTWTHEDQPPAGDGERVGPSPRAGRLISAIEKPDITKVLR